MLDLRSYIVNNSMDNYPNDGPALLLLHQMYLENC